MKYSLMERKRLRYNFGGLEEVVEIPNLLDTQMESYNEFLFPHGDEPSGIHKAFESVFPISAHNGKAHIEYHGYTMGEPPFTVDECRKNGTSYAAPVYAKLSLAVRDKADKNKLGLVKAQDNVYMGDTHLMTPTGSFIVNGTERSVVSQLHRSPGVFFNHDGGGSHISGKFIYSARIIPYNGSWLDFEFDIKENLFARIDRRHRLPINYLLSALDFTNEEILAMFFATDKVSIGENGLTMDVVPEHLRDETVGFSIEDKKGKLLVDTGHRITADDVKSIAEAGLKEITIPETHLYGKVLAHDILVDDELIAPCNTSIDKLLMEQLREKGVKEINIIYTNELDRGPYISNTLANYWLEGKENAVGEIYKIMRPGDQFNREEAAKFFDNLFFNGTRYNLSNIGRMKLNKRLNREDLTGLLHLEKDDIVETIKILISIKDGLDEIDDIDSLENRRVRRVGEMVQNALRLGLLKVERAVKERLSLPDVDKQTPKDLISAKAVSASVREFFMSSQLSQLIDQVNPLSEVTHKRRVSALGPGGLSRERAGFEVRDVHTSHYGRLCPIETPEGPNIGLINSLAIYAKINSYGFLETPYRRVKDKAITDEVVYVSAMDEWNHVIASASAKVDKRNRIADEIVPVRYRSEVMLRPATEVTLIDVSPKQLISVATSLIPFLEHDDANRALMGSNMQRQAVPLVKREKPLVGTGMEKYVARDSGRCVVAKRGGVVEEIDSKRIVVRVTDDTNELPVDIYPLETYRRTNYNTCINQLPSVEVNDVVGVGDIIADGSASDLGELAIGSNMRIGLMCWKGYNFEDSILLSERLVADERLTSIHIVELTCTSRTTKLGDEEITRDIPNVGKMALASLDESGIVQVGAEVRSGDILVGMVTPKSEEQLTPEENLLRAIFGEKALNVKDNSLRVSPGVKGTVVDVQIFTREGVDKDERAKAEDKAILSEAKNTTTTQYEIYRKITAAQFQEKLAGKQVEKGKGFKSKHRLTKKDLENLELKDIFNLSMSDSSLNDQLDKARANLIMVEKELNKNYSDTEKKIKAGDTGLAPGVLKIVKVYVAVKRHIQSGDKMAGRHGNKGVVSAIVPVEDMPYDVQGNPLDVVLSPLGLPSRMNIGQLLEAHLGYAAKSLGEKIQELLDQEKQLTGLLKLLKSIYGDMDTGSAWEHIESMDETELRKFCGTLKDGVPMATYVFNGATEEDIERLLKLAKVPHQEKEVFYDGRTGDAFHQNITSGYMYMLKLNHLVEDKIHARSIGSYGLVTQQPLGGKSKMGGQRFGEMEVWALEAYGAAYTLQEMLTVKSDDVEGRKQVYKNIIDGNSEVNSYVPESFNVLIKEIRSLCLNIECK